MMDMEQEPLLYQSAVECMVGEQMATTAWERMCKWASTGMNVENATAEFAAVEKRIKDEYGIKSMPATWRSNKSVILKALNKGVELWSAGSGVPAKSDLEKTLKGMEPTPSISFEQLMTAHNNMYALYQQAKKEGLTISHSFKRTLEARLQDINFLLKDM